MYLEVCSRHVLGVRINLEAQSRLYNAGTKTQDPTSNYRVFIQGTVILAERIDPDTSPEIIFL